jgi:hypothetical protein
MDSTTILEIGISVAFALSILFTIKIRQELLGKINALSAKPTAPATSQVPE